MNTFYVLLGVACFLLALEGYTFKSDEDNWWKITTVMRWLGEKFPLSIFIAGVLVGHFWW